MHRTLIGPRARSVCVLMTALLLGMLVGWNTPALAAGATGLDGSYECDEFGTTTRAEARTAPSVGTARQLAVAPAASAYGGSTYGYDRFAVTLDTERMTLLAERAVSQAAGDEVGIAAPPVVGGDAATTLVSLTSTPSGTPARSIDSGGTIIDRASIRTTVSAQRQGRHVLGDRLYNGGGYFRDAGSPQRVLDAFHDGSAQVLGVTRNGHVVVRVPSVTGFNNNPAAGFVDQATNVFFIKGSSSPSVVPTNPNWAP